MNHLERTAAALEEINPPVAAAIRKAGPNASGDALPGLLTWLPAGDLTDLAKACWLAAGDGAAEFYGHDDAAEFAEDMLEWPGPWWRPSTQARVTEAVLTWSRAHGREALLDLLQVEAGERIES